MASDKHKQLAPSTQDPDDPEISLMVPEKQKAITSIKQLNLRATPTQLAAQSGLSISQSAFWLNKIAGETQGKLEVAADGTIYYSFVPHFTRAYLQHGIRKVALRIGAALFHLLYWMIRVSFGVALILSLLVIVLLFVLLIIMAKVAAGGDDSSGGDGIDFWSSGNFFDLNFFADLFIWNYSPSHTPYRNSLPNDRRDKYSAFVDTHPKGNFFLDCFSFLFGDGAPNSNLEEIRWRQIAAVIKDNGGVVSTEQLAPFLDGDRSDSGMILGALAQFNGRPEVTRSGYIVYVFPEFLDKHLAHNMPTCHSAPYLQEDEWRFSAFPPAAIARVLVLACCNFAGSWWLFKHIATIQLLHEVALLIDVLLAYAAILLVIPAVRLLAISFLNFRLRQRNTKREAAYQLLQSRQNDILEELQEAREVREQELATLPVPDRRIVFSSDQDSVEQQFKEPS